MSKKTSSGTNAKTVKAKSSKNTSSRKATRKLHADNERRGEERRRQGLKFLLVSFAILGVMVFSPLFTVRNITVDGNMYIDKAEVIRISGVYFGERLFQMDTVAIKERMMRDLRLEDVSVRRALPDTFRITVKERAPVATVTTDYGYADIDRQGKIIDCYKNLKKMPIPMITGISLTDKYIGDDAEEPILKDILFFLQQLDAVSLNQISEVAIVAPDYIVAYTTKSVQIRLGKLERLEEKAKLTADFLDDLQENKREIEFVDFNYTAPFVKLKEQ